jgi:hypothetical protein
MILCDECEEIQAVDVTIIAFDRRKDLCSDCLPGGWTVDITDWILDAKVHYEKNIANVTRTKGIPTNEYVKALDFLKEKEREIRDKMELLEKQEKELKHG